MGIDTTFKFSKPIVCITYEEYLEINVNWNDRPEKDFEIELRKDLEGYKCSSIKEIIDEFIGEEILFENIHLSYTLLKRIHDVIEQKDEKDIRIGWFKTKKRLLRILNDWMFNTKYFGDAVYFYCP